MKKAHLILLIVTAIMALFSAYSLAAINQVYKIDFEWFSQYVGRYIEEERDTSYDKWTLTEQLSEVKIGIIRDLSDYRADDSGNENKLEKTIESLILTADYEKYILMYCSLGKVYSPEYRIKIKDIAQRGNVVEIKVSMNSPLKDDTENKEMNREINSTISYYPVDVIRIDKNAFPSKGKLYFIFKNQAGKQIAERCHEIK